jgi:hypothetical protein
MVGDVFIKLVIGIGVVTREVATFSLLNQVVKKMNNKFNLTMKRDCVPETYVAPGSVVRVPFPAVASILMRSRSAFLES